MVLLVVLVLFLLLLMLPLLLLVLLLVLHLVIASWASFNPFLKSDCSALLLYYHSRYSFLL